jgi:predicted metalloprotease with PDZ domain
LTAQEWRDALARIYANLDTTTGRAAEPLADTAVAAPLLYFAPAEFRSERRSLDFYSEAELMWLEADMTIRRLSGGRRSLDDFARTFFSGRDGDFVPDTYRFEDVVAALDAVQPHDWAAFLRARLEGHGPGAPLDGLARGGYRLVYTDSPTDYFKSAEARRKVTDFSYSVGMTVGKDAAVGDVQWDGPAFKAGLIEGTQIVAVNGEAYGPEVLKDAVRQAKGAGAAIELLVRENDSYRTVRIDYHEGLRYPRLERIPGLAVPPLDAILTPIK